MTWSGASGLKLSLRVLATQRCCIGSLGGKPGPTTYEYEWTGANGQTVWLSWNIYPLINQDGKVFEYQSVGRTITEHKEAEEALRESEQRFRDLADKAPVGISA